LGGIVVKPEAAPVIPWLWRISVRDHGPNDKTLKHVLLTISTYMNDQGHCFPSQDTIARGASMAPYTVQKAIAQANASGWIAVFLRQSKGQRWRRYEYRACIPASVELSDSHQELFDVGVLTLEPVDDGFELVGKVVIRGGQRRPRTKRKKPCPQVQGDQSGTTKVTNPTTAGDQSPVSKVPIPDGTKFSFSSSQYKSSTTRPAPQAGRRRPEALSPDERRRKALKAIELFPQDCGDPQQLARVSGLTEDEMQQALES
jgi:hypothetical protein